MCTVCYTGLVFLNLMETRNRCPGINSASLCSLAGRYDNPIPTRCLAPIDFLKIPAQYTMYTVKAKRKGSFTFDPGGHGPVPEFIDPRFRENKLKTLVFSH
jgi:hypothetical protein